MARWPALRNLDDTGALAVVMLRVMRGCGVDAGVIVMEGVGSGAGCGLAGPSPGVGAWWSAGSPPAVGTWLGLDELAGSPPEMGAWSRGGVGGKAASSSVLCSFTGAAEV